MEKFQLVCLPFAGAGASFFNAWKGLDASLDIVAPQLPGREKRFLDTPHVDVRSAADELIGMLNKEGALDAPSLIFGHSLGAVLAFELARRWEVRAPGSLLGVVVSGSPGPSTPRASRASAIADDDAFVAKVGEFSGYRHEAMADPMMRELLLPVLRADVSMHESYKAAAGDSLRSPVLTLRGIDDELVDRGQVTAWEEASSGLVRHEELPGGHMYFIDDGRSLLGRVVAFGRTLAGSRTGEVVS